MTSGLAVRPSSLPNIETATLPASYERAKAALAFCDSIDECKGWADKAAALASYAKQADDPTLHHLAVRIQARALRRCGELLQTFQSPGARTDQPAAGARPRLTQREAAAGAGMSEHQEKQAVRVAHVPAADFEAAVESEDPPTVTRLAELGTKTQPRAAAPAMFAEATHVIGVLHEFATFCAAHQAPEVALAVLRHEVAPLRADADAIGAWLAAFLAHLSEAKC